MSSPNLRSLVSAVEAFAAFDAKQRIPEEYRGAVSFFSWLDEWIYNTSEGGNVCEECRSLEQEHFFGSELRGLFPWLEIENENTIYPRVHPNCQCKLIRTSFVNVLEEEE